MRKSCGRRIVRLVGKRSVRWTLMAVAVMGADIGGPCSLTVTTAVAQDRGSPRASTSASLGNVATVDTEDGTDAGVDARSGTRRGDSSESALASIFHASAPIAVVTVVIAVMSFYLIALVVWMALHYRTPAAIPHDLVRDIQNLLEQNKFNEAYHRLAEDSSFLARVLASGVRKLPVGVAQAQRAMELANEDADHGDGASHDLPGHRGDARADDRAGGDGLRHDHGLPGHRTRGQLAPGQPARGGDLDGSVRDPRGNRDLDSGDLLLRHVPQPDRAAVAGGGDDGRALAGTVRAGRAAGAAEPDHQPWPGPGAIGTSLIPSPSAQPWRPPGPMPHGRHCRRSVDPVNR